MSKCPNCGADVSRRDQVCSYCGTENPNYIPPDDEVNALLEKGMNAYLQAEYALASACYRQAVELDPDIFTAYFYLAASLNVLGREEEAIEAMKKARDIRPGNTAVYYNLGLLSQQVGKTHEARAYLQQAQQLVESDPMLQDPKQMRQRIKNALADL